MQNANLFSASDGILGRLCLSSFVPVTEYSDALFLDFLKGFSGKN